ncbi:MAG: DUF1553 domain-containing protein [Acidobacteria bacterium]|nr:DUF1553 domain-containing protein [Acidobacteriota bacterium]
MNHEDDSEVELPTVSAGEIAAELTPDARAEREKLLEARAAVQKRLDAVPPLQQVYAVTPQPITPAHLLERGSILKPAAEVTPGALTAVRQLPPDLDSGADGERRLALARWITDPRNPLTARVIVNRVWQYHFGQGIVNTPSDFGFNGDRPSHPELLDWLANALVENGWSIRWLERLILSSRAYQQSAAPNAKAQSIDAGNRWLWRMPLKRMDAEMLRDSMLAVAGTLNPQRGGPGFLLQKKGDRGSYIYAAVDRDGPDLWRRSVYRFVVRGGDRIFLDSFDCPDPSVATPLRSVSNTPLQALTLMNNQFAIRQAGLLAGRLAREAGPKPAGQVRRAHQLLFGRDPRPPELERAGRFLERESMAEYCRALLNSNEFVYVP